MKAKEYLDKYYDDITSEDVKKSNEAALAIVNELFLEEPEKLRVARKVSTDDGLMGVMREINKKWISVCRLFEEKHGEPVLDKAAFVNFWVNRVPEMRDKF